MWLAEAVRLLRPRRRELGRRLDRTPAVRHGVIRFRVPAGAWLLVRWTAERSVDRSRGRRRRAGRGGELTAGPIGSRTVVTGDDERAGRCRTVVGVGEEAVPAGERAVPGRREPGRRLPLAPRPLRRPHPSRLPVDHPDRERILAAHDGALAAGQAGYPDPGTGLFVLTAGFLAQRGTCCGRGCRHCPYVDDDGPAADLSDAAGGPVASVP